MRKPVYRNRHANVTRTRDACMTKGARVYKRRSYDETCIPAYLVSTQNLDGTTKISGIRGYLVKISGIREYLVHLRTARAAIGDNK